MKFRIEYANRFVLGHCGKVDERAAACRFKRGWRQAGGGSAAGNMNRDTAAISTSAGQAKRVCCGGEIGWDQASHVSAAAREMAHARESVLFFSFDSLIFCVKSLY